jgi:hypothetical protein
MEEITPELERRIQVEELWGRRIVLEEMMNESRFREFESRRLLSLLGSGHGAEIGALKSALPTRIKPVRPAPAPAIFKVRHAALIAALALFSWLAGQQAYDKFATTAIFPISHKSGSSFQKTKSSTEARPLRQDEIFLKHSASKQRPLDADLKRIFGSSL